MMRLTFFQTLAIASICAIQTQAVSLKPEYDTLSQTTTEAEVEAGVGAEFENKVDKFSTMAYKSLKPALEKLQKFAGPENGEKLLGMTPIGKMLGLGAPGSFEKLGGKASAKVTN